MCKYVCVLLFFSSAAFGAVCPTGYVPVDWPANIKLSPVCNSDTVDLGVVDTECHDDTLICTQGLLCGAARKIKTADGGHATLYSNMHTSHAVHVSFGDATCYANLVAGKSDAGLHVQMDDVVYHTADLHQCRLKVNVSAAYEVKTPDNNSVSWSGKIAGVDFTSWAHCSSDYSSVGNTKNYLGVSTTTNDNRYCWCRMMVPVLSSWVYAASYSSGADCEQSCATSCASSFSGNSTFRSAIISGISF